MPIPSIRVAGLSKKYLLAHEKQRVSPTLRESVMNTLKGTARRMLHPLRSSAAERASLDTFWALKDVSFEVQPGERVGIVGRNGAGKSTLLKILSRITPPTAGRVEIKGRVASLLEVGTGFHADLTGRENIFLNGAILGMSRAEIRTKFDQIVAFAEVDRFLDTPVKRYSSGMYVRLAFAVAAHLTPEILIIDEVLAVGDAEFQKKCLGMMQDVSANEGRTVIFVSHNMAAVLALCTKGLYLSRGQLVHAGAAHDVVDYYVSKGESGSLNVGSVRGKDFELLNVKVTTPEGKPLTTFRPAVVELQYRVFSDIVDAGAHVMFEDMNGAPILGLETRDFVEKVPALVGQTVTCNFRIDSFPLNPGPFRLRLWLRSHSDHIHWEVPASYDVNVEETLVYGVRRIDRLVHGATAARVRAEVTAA